jgi:hypothetical protein
MIAFSLITLTHSSAAFASHTLNAEQKSVVAAWLGSNPGYRLAEDTDCLCDEDIQKMRTRGEGLFKAAPDYHPYWVTGEFNGDGVTDLAVVIVNERAEHDFTVLVFNGPLDPRRPAPAFVGAHLDMVGVGLFYWGSPPSTPYRLWVGRFGGDSLSLEPHGKEYRIED